MNVYYSVLTVLYVIVTVIFAAFILWNFFKTRKFANKVIGALALVMFVLRFFFIK